MRLVAFRLEGYRRFEAQSTLDLTPRVVALVGPNEAGKSTLLRALEHVTGDANREFVTSDFSGRIPLPDHRVVLSALFSLDEDDYTALHDVPGAESIRLWRRYFTADGRSRWQLIPTLSRPRATREALVGTLERLLSRTPRRVQSLLDAGYDELLSSSEEDGAENESPPIVTMRTALTDALTLLRDNESDLSDEHQARFRLLADLLDGRVSERSPAYLQRLPRLLIDLADEHSLKPPATRAMNILSERRPQVRVMRDSDRQLEAGYAFDDYEVPPDPLENLLHLAGVSWDELKSAASQPGNPALATLITRANRRLRERLHGSWRQARVSVELREQQGVLNVFPFDAESEAHSRIEDRSDGFRSFLALLAFTTRHAENERRLILAIDEAELHLHYDAQADLVRVLTQQTLVPQIIYSTHSAGCLPEDLGSAIRVVRPSPGDRSLIENGFWTSGAHGFTSLLMAMGAGAVAFTPARSAVITEGPSDALLLPALFRAATNRGPDEPLGLQVVGGLAWTPPRELASLEAQAARVVYLTDGDDAGALYQQRLEEAGAPRDHVFSLGGHGSELTIEDFIHKATYASVINDLLKRLYDYQGAPLRVGDIPNVGAARAAEDWTRRRGIKPVSKTAIAENVLRLSRTSLAYIYWTDDTESDLPLLRKDRAGILRQLLRRMRPLLGIEAPQPGGQ